MSCQPNGKTGGETTLLLAKKDIDMGKLNYKVPQSVEVNFQNTGDVALTIYNIETSCGCTVPDWTKKPVKPGNNGTISLKYDSDFPGEFRKTITVYYNGVNSPDTIILKGEVEYPEEITPKSLSTSARGS